MFTITITITIKRAGVLLLLGLEGNLTPFLGFHFLFRPESPEDLKQSNSFGVHIFCRGEVHHALFTFRSSLLGA
jgi:hypothetical protein